MFRSAPRHGDFWRNNWRNGEDHGKAFVVPAWDLRYGLWVRAGTPADVIEKIAHDMASVLRGAELRSWIVEHGGEPMDMLRNEFARFVVAQSTLAKDILTAVSPTYPAGGRF